MTAPYDITLVGMPSSPERTVYRVIATPPGADSTADGVTIGVMSYSHKPWSRQWIATLDGDETPDGHVAHVDHDTCVKMLVAVWQALKEGDADD